MTIIDSGACDSGFPEIQTDGWPGPNEGTALLFQPTRPERLVEGYRLASHAHAPASGPLGIDPARGTAQPATDDVPSIAHDVLGSATVGFGKPGQNPPIP